MGWSARETLLVIPSSTSHIKLAISTSGTHSVWRTELIQNLGEKKKLVTKQKLSPLLFILILEVLLKKVQLDKQIPGIKVKNFHFKYRIFADDILFFVEDPKANLNKLMFLVDEFGHFAGFYINLNLN